MARRTGRDFFVRVLNPKEVKTVEGILKPYGLGYNGGSFTRDEENGDVFHVGIDMRGKGTCNESGLMCKYLKQP